MTNTFHDELALIPQVNGYKLPKPGISIEETDPLLHRRPRGYAGRGGEGD